MRPAVSRTTGALAPGQPDIGAAAERGSLAAAHFYLAESYKALNKFDEARHEYELLIREYSSAAPRMAEFAKNNLADLELQKSVVSSTPAQGDTIVYTLTLTNNGPSTATGITVNDALSILRVTPRRASSSESATR